MRAEVDILYADSLNWHVKSWSIIHSAGNLHETHVSGLKSRSDIIYIQKNISIEMIKGETKHELEINTHISDSGDQKDKVFTATPPV